MGLQITQRIANIAPMQAKAFQSETYAFDWNTIPWSDFPQVRAKARAKAREEIGKREKEEEVEESDEGVEKEGDEGEEKEKKKEKKVIK